MLTISRRKKRKNRKKNMIDDQPLITSAYNEFVHKRFASSLSSLTNLLQLKPNDPKVLHNKAVVELYISNHRNINSYQQALREICSHMNINPVEAEVPDDLDHCVLYYNQAVVYFHQNEFELALGIITKVFSLVQPMDSVLAYKVCLLLLELNLYCGQIEKAQIHLSYIENQFLSSGYSKLGQHDKDVTSQSAIISPEEFCSRLLNYKIRCFLEEKNYDECMKVIDKMYSGDAQNFYTIISKAHIQFMRKEYEAAYETITKIQEDVDNFFKMSDTRTLVYWNNIATIYFYLEKPGFSNFFMHKAFKLYRDRYEALQKTKKEKIGERDLFLPKSFPKLIYNRGLALLFAKKPTEAFDCFMEVVQISHRSPIVWLRLAECCISLHKFDNDKVFNFMDNRTELVACIAASEEIRRTVLNPNLYKDTAYNSQQQSYSVPLPTMEFASLCACNAYLLLNKNSEPQLIHSVLAASSYIHLTIGDPVKAHMYAIGLFNDPRTSVTYKYLSALYLSEALVMLNRISEAIEVLNPKIYKDLDFTNEARRYDWVPRTQTTAQAVLQYNLAVALTIRGDLKKASEILKHVWIAKGQKAEIPIHVIALALYIELVLGHHEIARTIIKQNCPQAFSMS